jgi:ribose 5-phosphate isomerase B
METKRFDIITEADARRLEPGTTVRLAPRGHITPLAADTLRERRVTVVAEGAPIAADADLVPVADIRRLAIGSDHVGFELKAHLVVTLRGRGLQVHDVGILEKAPADYPDIAAAVARQVARREADAGIVIDGAGLGSATETLARYSREHNGANVLTLGATLLTPAEATAIVTRFIETPMREARYVARLAKIARLEHR